MNHGFKIGDAVKSRHEGGPSGVVVDIRGDDIVVKFGVADDQVMSTFPSYNLLPVNPVAKEQAPCSQSE